MKQVASPLWLSLMLLVVTPAVALAQERAAPPDVTLPAATRRAVMESLIVQIDRGYVFPDVGTEVVKALRRHAARGDYDPITSARAFADTLTAHLYAVAHDLHLRVHYDPDMGSGCGGPSPVAAGPAQSRMRLRNFGFERLQRLAGNVGYLDLRVFEDPASGAGDVAAAAMGYLANCDALIVDVRRNGGGSGAMVALLITYLLEGPGRMHLFDFYFRNGSEVTVMQDWTLPYVPGPRFAGKDVYVLTSRFTGSAAESYAYAVRVGELATVVGEKTAGAGNLAGATHLLPGGFAAFVAPARVVNPITKTGWEGVGVEPNVEVPADLALREAHVRAVKALLDRATADEDKTRLRSALEQAERTPPDPLEPPPGLRIIGR